MGVMQSVVADQEMVQNRCVIGIRNGLLPKRRLR